MRRYQEVRDLEELLALPPREHEMRARALEAIAEARRLKVSLSAAARRAGTTIDTVLRYAAPAVERRPNGRYYVRESDRLYRRVQVVSTRGVVWVDTWSSLEAQLASAHANAIREYGFKLTGDYDSVLAFAGQQVGGAELETDILPLGAIAASGDLDDFELYDSTTT